MHLSRSPFQAEQKIRELHQALVPYSDQDTQSLWESKQLSFSSVLK